MNEEKLQQRVLEVSKKHNLSHIGSCLSVLPILIEIYEKKKPEDLIIMDNAHAHIAHLVVREAKGEIDNVDKLIEQNGIHCDRSVGCDASGGSLGHGIGISLGLALADRSRTVFCTASDGSLMEGSNWEALRIAQSLGLKNLEIHANMNGYSAVAPVDRIDLGARLLAFYPDIKLHHTDNTPAFEGVKGHYITVEQAYGTEKA
jgi:transketolase